MRTKESEMMYSGVVGRHDQMPSDPDADFVQPRKPQHHTHVLIHTLIVSIYTHMSV
jgi:hypothetical protein